MKAILITIGIIVLIAVIYWLYKSNKTTSTIIVPITPKNVANTSPLVVTYANTNMSSSGRNILTQNALKTNGYWVATNGPSK